MFTGGEYGVGLTVAPTCPAVPKSYLVPAGVIERPMRLGEAMPVASRTAEEKAAELRRIAAARSMLAAYEAELVASLADDRPAGMDPTGRGARSRRWAADQELPGVSEFFVDELSAVLNCSNRAAADLAHTSWVLRESLPGTLAALADGRLDWPRARVLVDVLGHVSRSLARAVESELLPDAPGLSLRALRARAERALLARDSAAADQRKARAERAADVRCYPTSAGMGQLAADLALPVAEACRDMVDRLAHLAKTDGDDRPIGQVRAGVLADLILRPGDTSRPPISAHLDLTAPLAGLLPPGPQRYPGAARTAAEPAEVNGSPITLEAVRALLEQLDAVCPGGLQAPLGGSLSISITGRDGGLLATTTRSELARIARRGCPTHLDAACSCALLARPTRVDRYQPSAAQRRFVTTPDQRCRFPNCGHRAGWADLDHVVAHAAGGETDCTNLCCLCRRHHRLKTHSPGWRFTMGDDGVLYVTTPSGVTRTTRPPGLRPPRPEPLDPPVEPPPAESELDDDPPPF